MKSPIAGIAALFVLFAVLIVGYGSVFTVDMTEQSLVVRLGEPIRVVTEPGLNFKAPFIDTVISIDKRILDLENPSQEVIASDQKRLVVDAFARYRIKNALRFYQSIGTIQAANIQLTTLLNAALRRARRGHVYPGRAGRARGLDGAHPRPTRQGSRRLWHPGG
jgi:membrane protease subunit HflC